MVGGGDEEGGAFTPTTPFFDGPLNANTAQFTKLLQDNAIVMVNFYAPWCCLLYTSDDADEGIGVDLGGRRIMK